MNARKVSIDDSFPCVNEILRLWPALENQRAAQDRRSRMDVVLQLLNRILLIGHNGFDDVVD